MFCKLMQQAFQFCREPLGDLPAILHSSPEEIGQVDACFDQRPMNKEKDAIIIREIQQRLPIRVFWNNEWQAAQAGYEQRRFVRRLGFATLPQVCSLGAHAIYYFGSFR